MQAAGAVLQVFVVEVVVVVAARMDMRVELVVAAGPVTAQTGVEFVVVLLLGLPPAEQEPTSVAVASLRALP